MGAAFSSNNRVKKMVSENVIGMKHIEEVWAKYSKGQEKLITKNARKFLKNLATELKIELSDELIDNILLLCDPQTKGEITLESFVQLFLEVRDQAQTESNREIKVTHSVLFTGEMQKAILEAQRSLNDLKPESTVVFGEPLDIAASRNRDFPLVPAPLVSSARWLE